MDALLYLLLRQWKGAVLNMLRSGARTLTGLLVAAWFFSQILNSALVFGRIRPEFNLSLLRYLPVFQGVLLFALLIPAYTVLVKGFNGDLVTFSAADVDFLFSMPVPQRTVLGFRLAMDALRMIGIILMGVLWLSPLLGGSIRAGIWDLTWRAIPALFFCFFFLLTASHAVYILYSYRVRASELLNRVVKVGGVVVAVALILIIANDAARGQTPWEQAARIFAHPVVRTLLLPLTLAVDTILSAQPAFPQVTAIHLILLAVLAVAGLAAVLGQKENVYEPSLAVSLRKSRMREALRSGGFSGLRMELLREKKSRPVRTEGSYAAPFLGTGWRALLWKNVQIWMRAPWTLLVLFFLVGLGIPLLLTHYLQTPTDRSSIDFIPLGWVYLIWLLGVSVVQQVRSELAQGSFLKTAPIPAWKVVVSLVTLPTAACALALWLFLAACAVLFRDQAQPFLLPLAVVGPLMAAALALFHALIAILYPRQRDPVHRLLSGLIMLPGWGVLLMLPLGAAGAFLFLFQRGAGPSGLDNITRAFSLAVTAALAAIYLSACALLLWWASAAFRAYSPADE